MERHEGLMFWFFLVGGAGLLATEALDYPPRGTGSPREGDEFRRSHSPGIA